MNIDLYELIYRNYKNHKKNKPDTYINISENTAKSIMNILKSFQNTKSLKRGEINFSDVICNVLPVFDEKTNNLSYWYEYIFINGNKNGNPIEYLERYKKFNIDTLPLIDVAKFLNIKVEKSNTLKPYGMYKPAEKKIILGSDYAPTFIHELAHAIDHVLGNSFENYHLENTKNFDELVAELSTVILCKTYNVSINESYAMYYLDAYSALDISTSDLLKRVSLIYEYVKICIIEMNNQGGRQSLLSSGLFRHYPRYNP
jgi:hypothetical protein